MPMPGRSYQSSNSYRYGFNGKEKVNETYGEGNTYDFGDRMYDPRLVRWMSIDPEFKKYPEFSGYIFAANNPLYFIDLKGREIIIHYINEHGEAAQFKYMPRITPPNNDFVKNTIEALNAIHKVEGEPQNTINQFAHAKNVTVNINNSAISTTDVKTATNGKDATINWNDKAGGAITDDNGKATGETQSPMTILAHEIGHAKHAASDNADFKKDKNTPLPNFDNQEEKNQINGIEKDVAKYYGEGIRTNHRGNDIKTSGSTSNTPVVSDVNTSPGLTELKPK